MLVLDHIYRQLQAVYSLKSVSPCGKLNIFIHTYISYMYLCMGSVNDRNNSLFKFCVVKLADFSL